MQQRLKSWESPRSQGRNKKGKGGSARARQLKKKFSTLRQKLKGQSTNNNTKERESQMTLSFFLYILWKQSICSYNQKQHRLDLK